MLRSDFASDNTAGAAPEALASFIEADRGFVASYGEDPVTARAADLIRGLLDADAEVRFVASGTAANALALATLCRSFEAVLAHEHAHVATSEVAAPSFYGGGLSITGLPGVAGRIDPAAFEAALGEADSAHHPSPAALSLTNATEYGTLYSVGQIRELIARAKAARSPLGVHLDGARLAMAAAAGFEVQAVKSLGVDILILGGTKAGMTPTEAIVLYDKALARRFDARLKQGGQLPSKSRYYAAPWIGMLESGAFVARAAHANAMARKLAAAQPFELAHPVETNAVFVSMPAESLRAVHAAGWEIHPVADGSVRLMCSWATTDALVEEMAEVLRRHR
ncbi:MAG TPA: beta-eliminating lyase-related protein [Caulobacteraceae bacterium]|nr:beta-eliminating lyase-related protein [Caulobacteraceae bacterium]